MQCIAFEYYLLKVDVLGGEPFAAEHNHRPTQAVHAALVKTTDARDLRQVLDLSATQKAFVSGRGKSQRLVSYRSHKSLRKGILTKIL